MDLRITPKKLSGTVTPPPSKSMAHRLIIAASLGDGTSTIRNVAFSKDIEATLRCMETLGAEWFRQTDDTVCVRGIRPRSSEELPHFDCGESGSTLRFLIPIALAAPRNLISTCLTKRASSGNRKMVSSPYRVV